MLFVVIYLVLLGKSTLLNWSSGKDSHAMVVNMHAS
jgi:hypothetical protein